MSLNTRLWQWLILFCFCFMLTSTTALAQQDSTHVEYVKRQRWMVETKDGSVIQGVFLGQDDSGIRLLTDSMGEINIPASNIKSYKILSDTNYKEGIYWFDNPNATRYLFSPSAFSLKKGEAYYQNTYLVINSFNYGITDQLTIGAGVEIISTFSGEPTYFITPKYSFPISEKVRAGAGILYANSTIADNNFSGVGIGYGILTYGTTDHNATVGLGYGYVDGSIASKPIFTFSGMTRLGRKTGLVTENWIVPIDGYYGVFSYGIRFMGEKITVDLAFINSPEIAESVVAIGIPYVDFVVKFGK